MWHCDSWHGILLQKLPVAFGSESTFCILLCVLVVDLTCPGQLESRPYSHIAPHGSGWWVGSHTLAARHTGSIVKDTKGTVPYQMRRILYSQRQQKDHRVAHDSLLKSTWPWPTSVLWIGGSHWSEALELKYGKVFYSSCNVPSFHPLTWASSLGPAVCVGLCPQARTFSQAAVCSFSSWMQLLSPRCNLKGFEFQNSIIPTSSHQSCLVFFQKLAEDSYFYIFARLQWLQFCLEDSEGSWSSRWHDGTSAFTSWGGPNWVKASGRHQRSTGGAPIENLILVKSKMLQALIYDATWQWKPETCGIGIILKANFSNFFWGDCLHVYFFPNLESRRSNRVFRFLFKARLMHRGLANHSYSRCRVATSRQNSGFGMSLRKFDSKYSSILLGGGFTIFFSPLPGEKIQFD